MLVFKTEYVKNSPCVLALGCFDTVHLGHQKLIKTALAASKKQNIPLGIYMFESRPELCLKKDAKKDVYSSAEREYIFNEIGVDYVYYEAFTSAFRQMSPEEFVLYLKEKFDVRTIVVGFNYRFGNNASGDSGLLAQLSAKCGIRVIVVDAVCDDAGVISSTRVRICMEQGDVAQVKNLLGRYYVMRGKVHKDRGVGRTLGFPTANLEVAGDLLLPKNGVYMTIAYVDGARYASVTNVGVRPTFGLNKCCIEAHLLDFDGDLYGKEIKLAFCSYLRGECVFSDERALRKQISEDILTANRLFLEINSETLQI